VWTKECVKIILTIPSYRNYFREFAVWTLELARNLGLREALNLGNACSRPQCKCVIRDSEKVYSQQRYRWTNRTERRRTEGCINITLTITYRKPIRWISTSCNVNVAICIHANSYDLRSKCFRNYINTVASSAHVRFRRTWYT